MVQARDVNLSVFVARPWQEKGRSVDLRPFVFGTPWVCQPLIDRLARFDPLIVDVFDEATVPFFQLMNVANAMAYGSLGMPAWVQLDCCTMPSAMIGYACRRRDCEPALWERWHERVTQHVSADAGDALRDFDGWLPISSFAGLPSTRADVIVGVSLYSLLLGQGLGLRTKALALFAHQAPWQLGITQYDNRAVRTHCALGPLEVVAPRAWPHDRALNTFTYRLRVPDDETLLALIEGRLRRVSSRHEDTVRELALDAAIADEVAARQARGDIVAIVWPGHRLSDTKTYLCLGCLDKSL